MNTFDELIPTVAPEKYAYLVKSAEEVKQSPFADEILAELLLMKEKVSMDGNNLVGGLALAAGAGIAQALAGDMYQAVRRGLTKGKNYQMMMAHNPDLKAKPARNVQAMFSTLHRFNPEFSADPLVSGSFVRQQLNMASSDESGAPVVDISSLKNIIDARKSMSEGSKSPIAFKTPELSFGGAGKERKRKS